MATFEIMVKFTDDRELILKSVADYGIQDEHYYVVKNGYKIFINLSEVKYIGRTFDINNEPLRLWLNGNSTKTWTNTSYTWA